jgi:hypothetical protein
MSKYVKPMGLFIACFAPVFAGEVAVFHHHYNTNKAEDGLSWKDSLRVVTCGTLCVAPSLLFSGAINNAASRYLGI